MTLETIIRKLSSFPGVQTTEANGNYFFVYDPDRSLPPERYWQAAIATVVASDEYDQFSALHREGVFRVNLHLGKDRCTELLAARKDADAPDDFTALDRLLPHPMYAAMGWLSVLNPGPVTAELVNQLLTEACEEAVRRADVSIARN